MPLVSRFEARDGYTAVRLRGEPSLGQFLSFIELMQAETAAWPHRRALFDLRGIATLKAVSEHLAVGQAVVRHLAHLEKIASVVPTDRATGVSRKLAQGQGVNLAVFVDEAEAIAWLRADA